MGEVRRVLEQVVFLCVCVCVCVCVWGGGVGDWLPINTAASGCSSMSDYTLK